MSFVASILNIFLEALFPISPEERAVLSMDPKQSFEILRRAKKSPILEACGIFSYKDQRIRKLIWSIKYKKSLRGSAFAGYALYHILKSYSNAVSPIIIVPMPITKRRRRERGYNQCELIINEVEKLDTDHRLTFSRDILFRKLHMSRQTLKDRKERIESAKDIFVADVEAIDKLVCKLGIDKSKDYLVIVIDDVITTGSTILDAIKTLRKAGLEKTFGLSVAH
jgi:predicted amidophosphoribosyltransferase